ncbi:hypothetical protein TCON_0366 [Astathelohania contejeani]|uniref:Uncharacterized protein n=1 Tax=Astathelohania contejeani TaxID=164912 RepID=A0ABQ7I211_9MICR|nr:hypothetical protein TCON_0366 [Thelohania contejeani]
MIMFFYIFLCLASKSAYNCSSDDKNGVIKLKYDSLSKYVIFDIENKEDSDRLFFYMVAIHAKEFKKTLNGMLAPNGPIFAIFNKNSYSFVDVAWRRKSKLIIPLVPLGDTLFLTNDVDLLRKYTTKSLNNFLNVNFKVHFVFEEITKEISMLDYDLKYYKLLLQDESDLYNEPIGKIFQSSYKILKTLQDYNDPIILKLKRQFRFYRERANLLDPIKTELRKLLKYLTIPKYHYLLKIKYMLAIIAEIQCYYIKFSRRRLKSNYFYLLDKFYEKFDMTEQEDKLILTTIANAAVAFNKKYNKLILNENIFYYKNFGNIIKSVTDAETCASLKKMTDRIHWIRNSCEYYSDYMKNTEFYTICEFYSHLWRFEGFDFLIVCADMMYTHFYLSELKKSHCSSYCFMYEKLIEYRPLKFDTLMNLAFEIPTDIPKNIINIQLKDIDVSKYPELKEYHKKLEEFRSSILINSIASGVSICDISNNFISFTINLIEKNMNFNIDEKNTLEEWISSAEYSSQLKSAKTNPGNSKESKSLEDSDEYSSESLEDIKNEDYDKNRNNGNGCPIL